MPRRAPVGERTAHAAASPTPPSLPPLQPTRRWWAAAAHAGRVHGLCALAAAARDARVQVHRHAGGAAAHSIRGGAAHSNSQHSASKAASGHLAAILREEAAALDATTAQRLTRGLSTCAQPKILSRATPVWRAGGAQRVSWLHPVGQQVCRVQRASAPTPRVQRARPRRRMSLHICAVVRSLSALFQQARMILIYLYSYFCFLRKAVKLKTKISNLERACYTFGVSISPVWGTSGSALPVN